MLRKASIYQCINNNDYAHGISTYTYLLDCGFKMMSDLLVVSFANQKNERSGFLFAYVAI